MRLLRFLLKGEKSSLSPFYFYFLTTEHKETTLFFLLLKNLRQHWELCLDFSEKLIKLIYSG